MRTTSSLRMWTIVQVAMYVVFGLALLAGGYRLETTVDETHSALCSFKADLERRARATEDFILAHPRGVPGISRADFERSLSNIRRSLGSLRSLECGTP